MKYNEKSVLIAEETFNWCCQHLGTPIKSFPKLKVITDRRYKQRFGEYENKEITVFLNTCRHRKDIIGTIIHEYTHFLQMPRKKDVDKYHRLSETHLYRSHPYEIEAEQYADFFTEPCLKHLRRKGVI